MSFNIKTVFELDRLNPIIVKELRQGNRSKAFLLNFLLAQVAMLLFVVLALSNASMGSASSVAELNVGFWVILGFFLIIGVPLAGFNAINSERAEARLDLLHMTRLSAFAIVCGKWFALVSQSLLITLSIVPYVIARYYFGGVNVVSDLMVIGALLGFSALVSGLSISLSSFKSVFLRIALIGGLIWMSATLASMLLGSLFSRGGFSTNTTEIFIVVLFQSFFFLIVALEFSASSISPLAENRQSRMRFWFLLQMIFVGVFALVASDDDFVFTVAGFSIVVGIFVLSCSLMYAPVRLSSIYRPFVKRGIVGKLVGRYILYPGYPSALFLTIASVVFYFGFFIYYFEVEASSSMSRNTHFYAYMQILFPSVLGCFFMPVALTLLLERTGITFVNRFCISAIVLLVIGMVSAVIGSNYGTGVFYLFSWVPFNNIFAILSYKPHEINYLVFTIGSITTAVLSIFYVYMRGREWRSVERELEQLAEELIANEKLENTVDTQPKVTSV
ncbi:MAG: ABC transporter permease [Opitutaceae bacterium]